MKAPRFRSVFDNGGLFDQFFGGTAHIDESFSTSGSTLIVDLDLPGVDPETVGLHTRSNELRATWVDRFGAKQSRYWTLDQGGCKIDATLANGLLRIEIRSPITADGRGPWVDVPIARK